MTAFPEQSFEMQNKKQFDFICPGLDFVSWTVHESSIIKKKSRCNY